jgi:hypothetical protein
MAKAIDESTPLAGEWLPLDQAFERIMQQTRRSPEAAEAEILRILKAGYWRGQSFDGAEIFDGAGMEPSIWRWGTKLDMPRCTATFDWAVHDLHFESVIRREPMPGQVITRIGVRAMDGIRCIEVFLPIDDTEHPAISVSEPEAVTTVGSKTEDLEMSSEGQQPLLQMQSSKVLIEDEIKRHLTARKLTGKEKIGAVATMLHKWLADLAKDDKTIPTLKLGTIENILNGTSDGKRRWPP